MNKKEIIAELTRHHYDLDDLKGMSIDELRKILDDINDTSSWHPNETLDEILEHEDND